MPRNKKNVIKRKMIADPIFDSATVTKLINRLMKGGKKTVAQKIVYSAFDLIKEKTKEEPLAVFQKALANVVPAQEVKSRRVGGANYQVPIPVKKDRGEALAMRWIIEAARSKKGKPMKEDLAQELIEAAKGEGEAIKKRTDMQRMADANRAFAHFRW